MEVVMKDFRLISPEELENVFRLIGHDWMLVCAEKNDRFNAMTASWGGMGVIWRKKVAYVFVRPQRYTYEFIEKSDKLTLSFFSEEYREALRICGTKSGREVDKISHMGLKYSIRDGACIFDDASVSVICSKLYAQDLEKCCFTKDIADSFYSNGGYHKMYICEIKDIIVK
jgi:flavin reductase (DIM6/NTAB) family NADH-FMN oxidoreductase RutF